MLVLTAYLRCIADSGALSGERNDERTSCERLEIGSERGMDEPASTCYPFLSTTSLIALTLVSLEKVKVTRLSECFNILSSPISSLLSASPPATHRTLDTILQSQNTITAYQPHE